MNLWFRLTALLLRRPWRHPAHFLDTTVVRVRVWPLDLDLNRHVTNARYFALADLARLDNVLRTGALKIAFKKKAMQVVGDTWGKFRRELKLFEVFEIHSRGLGWDDKWGFFEHRFLAHGRVVGVVVTRGVFRNAQGPVPVMEIVNGLGLPAISPELPSWAAQWSASCEAMSELLRAEEKSS